MSGIVGLLNLDGAPVEHAIVARLTDLLDFRGPDAKNIWVEGLVAFGHTLLKTTPVERECQPYSLDGKSWIVADARLDDRLALMEELISHGQPVAKDAPDVQAILCAYHVWQERCVEHLSGDFAFAIWDGGRRRLFGARDQMGVKPFYYSLVGSRFLFSNTLDCVRKHAAVSNRLNELAVADFLISGFNQQVDATFFADIRRLPPAHTLTLSAADGLNITRYWNLPIDEPVYYPRTEDYIDQFRDLLKKTVGERLSPGPIGIFMSGGLDSSAIAATIAGAGAEYRPQAFTSVYDELIPDEERHYAGMVASHLQIPIHYRVLDEEPIGAIVGQSIHTPEPAPNPLCLKADRLYLRELSCFSRVFFYGEGPDNALYFEWRPHFRYLVHNRRWAQVFSDLIVDTTIHRRIPFASRLGRLLNGSFSSAASDGQCPEWINSDFAQRLELKERSEQFVRGERVVHPFRPRAHSSLTSFLWPDMFENMDATWTGVPIDVRHPFVNVKFLRFLLSVPTIPWCRGKYLVRCALRGMVPEPIRRRPKSPLVGEPLFERLRKTKFRLPELSGETALRQYVNPQRLPEADSNPEALYINLRSMSLNCWLHGLESSVKST